MSSLWSKILAAGAVIAGILFAALSIFNKGKRAAFKETETVALKSQADAVEALNEAEQETSEGVKNVKKKLSNNDFSGFAD